MNRSPFLTPTQPFFLQQVFHIAAYLFEPFPVFIYQDAG